MTAALPKSFSYKTADDLIRLGRDYDGGYLVSQSDLDKSDILIGMGINDDWSFEKDFLKMNPVEVHAYDASINFRLFLNRMIKSVFLKFYNPIAAFHWGKTAWSYMSFFSKDKVFHFRKYVGLGLDDNKNCSFKDVIDKTKSQNIFFKIDIEGSEYRFLEDLIYFSDRISGLVIEFHDCDIHLNKIEDFIKKFKLKVAHIHINNFGLIRRDGIPLVMEITFSKSCKFLNEYQIPHPKDMPNNKYGKEIELTFK